MEPLDTTVEGDPASFTATCDWLRQASTNTEAVEDAFRHVRGDSESGWVGQAGEAARQVMLQGATLSSDAMTMLSDMADALQIHADDLRTVKKFMQDARDAAREGGLTVNGMLIMPPGPAPVPAQRPVATGPMAPQQRESYNAALAAEAAYTKKVRAYEDAAGIVAKAKEKESESQHILVRSISGIVKPAKLGLTLGDLSAGVTAATAARRSKYLSLADDLPSPKLPEHLAKNTNMSMATRFRLQTIAAERATTKAATAAKAYPSRIAQGIDRVVPQRISSALDAKIIPHQVPKPTNWFLKGSTYVGKKIPYVGVAFTAAGVGYDISQGKDPTQAVVSGGSSLIAGTLAGAAVGGPVGALVGAGVGIIAGIAVDETWDFFD